MSLSGMDDIRELDWISDEEERGIIKYPITDTFFGVKLNSETSWVTIGIRETSFPEGCRESYTKGGSLSYTVEELSLSELSGVIGYFKVSEGTSSDGMDDPFGNSFSIETGKFIN